MSARHTLTIPPDVQGVLRQSVIMTDRVLLPGQLERKLYTATMKVLTEYGGKWSRSAGAILIKADAREKLMSALESGVAVREKVVRQAFYTPDAVADRLLEFAEELCPELGRTDGDVTVLEPSAGDGSLIRAAVRSLAFPQITAVEIDEAECDKLQALGCVHKVVQSDFLALTHVTLGGFDLILMNPPYQRGQALKHIKHALSFLVPGGVLAAIVPENFPDHVGDVSFESKSRGAGAFKESGTNIRTKLIRCMP